MTTVFIAYDRVDEGAIIDPLRRHLQDAHGFDSVWFDEAAFGGVTFWEDTQRQIQRAGLVIYVVGGQAAERPILREAEAQSRPLIVVRTPAAPLPGTTGLTLNLQDNAFRSVDRTRLDQALAQLGLISSSAVHERPSDFSSGFDDLNFSPMGLNFPGGPDAPPTDDGPEPLMLGEQREAGDRGPGRGRLVPGLIAVAVTVAAVLIGINLMDATEELSNPTSFPTVAPLDRQGTNAAIEQTADALVPDMNIPGSRAAATPPPPHRAAPDDGEEGFTSPFGG
jgi:hypothetical protein